MQKPIITLASKSLYRGRVFELVEEQLQYPDGRVFERAFLKHNGAVVILPRLEDGTLLLVRQYRAALKRFILEFPAGTLEGGEEPLACARREIAEETGYAAAKWRPLGTLYPSPGICNELQYGFMAEDLTPHRAVGDEDELIEVERLSVPEVEVLICEGGLTDAKSIAVFAQARLKGLL